MKCFLRMFPLFIRGRITWSSLKFSVLQKHVAVPLIGGGMIFCDAEDERQFFGP